MSTFTSQPFNASLVRDKENLLLRGVYQWMSIGLLVTAFTGYYAVQSSLVALKPGALLMLMLVEIVIVGFFSARINKMSGLTATLLFLTYSALNGITLSPIAYIYSGQSIVSTFFICAAMFMSMSFYGIVTKRDLSSWSGFLTMGLFGLIAAGLVNIFVQSAQISFISSICGIVVFLGLTAWDTAKLKAYAYSITDEGSVEFQRAQMLGALVLYLDFINLFIYLLRLFGRRD